MKIIFLDIDGVLNVIPQGFDEYGAKFHTHFVENLNRVIQETNAKIVISSTWRMSGLNKMRNMWKKRNLPGEVIGITPNLYKPYKNDIGRGDEIKQWLDNTDLNITDYIIIDDDYFDMLPEQLPRLIKTSGNTDHFDCVDIGYGFTKECAEQSIKLLNHE